MPGGRIFLGMPKGFNRLGPLEDMKLWVYSGVDESVHEINMFNVAVWKHLDEHGNTLIRGYRPRTNTPFLWVILGNHMDRFECREITKEEVAEMD